MKLDEFMANNKGVWSDDGVATVQDRGGYFWRVALKTAGGVVITSDGKRMGIEAEAVVSSTRKPRAEKAEKAAKPVVEATTKSPEPPAEAPASLSDDDLDELLNEAGM